MIAGLTTDVCLYHRLVSALDAGYAVHAVADASGSSTELGDMVNYDRLRELGPVIATTIGTVFDLYPDLSVPARPAGRGSSPGRFAPV